MVCPAVYAVGGGPWSPSGKGGGWHPSIRRLRDLGLPAAPTAARDGAAGLPRVVRPGRFGPEMSFFGSKWSWGWPQMPKICVFGLHRDGEWQIRPYLVMAQKISGKSERIWSWPK